MFNVVICIVAIVLVRLDLVTRKDYLILVVLVLVFAFTVAQIETGERLSFDIEHNLTIAAIVSFAFINRTIHSRYVLILAWAISIWCLSLNLRLLKKDGPINQLIAESND